jgi:hypothetical protein
MGFRNPVDDLCAQPPIVCRVRFGYLAQPSGALGHPIHVGDGKLHQVQKRSGTLAYPGLRSTDYLAWIGVLSTHGAPPFAAVGLRITFPTKLLTRISRSSSNVA